MKFTYDDGGRAAAGYKGHAGDCVARSIAIATGRPYQEIYDRLAEGNATQRRSKFEVRKNKPRRGRTAANGITTQRKWFKDYMTELGFTWVPTMQVRQGCTVHLTDGELPMGRLVVNVSRHVTAVIDGVIHDTYNPDRAEDRYYSYPKAKWMGGRCVYGYWRLDKREAAGSIVVSAGLVGEE